ncbi:MAG: hypothetical protein ACRDTT_25165 [Pseudonocardiaceae bacterium]
MTITDERQRRTASDLLPFLPLALIITMFGMAVLIAQVAPSRETSGVYQVIVGEDPTQFRLARESLTCNRNGDTATCTAPVAGQQLTIDVQYRGPASVWDSTCTARHGNRPVSCSPQVTDRQASVSVLISDQLDVTEPELSRLRDAVPWWRTGSEPIADLALLCALIGAVVGVTAYLLSGRTRTPAGEWRFPIAVGTGVLGLALFVAGGLLIAPGRAVWLLIAWGAPVWVALTMLMAWQYQLGGAGGHGRARRWADAIGAAIVTAFYIAATMLVFLLESGFID